MLASSKVSYPIGFFGIGHGKCGQCAAESSCWFGILMLLIYAFHTEPCVWSQSALPGSCISNIWSEGVAQTTVALEELLGRAGIQIKQHMEYVTPSGLHTADFKCVHADFPCSRVILPLRVVFVMS